jgi:hypothetical protein
MLKKIKGVVVSVGPKFIMGSAFVVASAQSYGIDTTDIEAAYTSGNTAVGAAVGGLIALVAAVVGVGIVMSLLKKA